MKNKKNVHIVAFDVPYPPTYGGAIEVFYKLKALSRYCHIYLHCFEYGNRQANHYLQNFCAKVFYYPRRGWRHSLPLLQPHIVASRKNKALLNNLCAVAGAILFEGLHTTAYLNHADLAKRLKLVRMHNIESDYYHELAKNETTMLKKLYFTIEAWQLKNWETKLRAAKYILGISPADCEYLTEQFGGKVHYLPAFHKNTQVNAPLGKGRYVLYHGNLSVNENAKAATFVANKLIPQLPAVKFIIAGYQPQPALVQKINTLPNAELIASPSSEQLNNLINGAHIHLLPTFQATGIKLKLLNALYNGRFCVVNTPMVQQTPLAAVCYVADTSEALISLITQLMPQPFTQQHRQERENVLNQHFDNQQHAQFLYSLL